MTEPKEEPHVKHHRRRHPKHNLTYLWAIAFALFLAGLMAVFTDIETKLINIQKVLDERVIGPTHFECQNVTVFMDYKGEFHAETKKVVVKPMERRKR